VVHDRAGSEVVVQVETRYVATDVLEVAVEIRGPAAGWPVVLVHGFPYDPRSYDAVAESLAVAGAQVVVPYLRGYRSTTFRSATTPRSGQQGALGRDLVDLVEALELAAPVVAGFDWGGRAACIAAALRPELIGGLVAIGGYEIQDIASFARPEPPLQESRAWYQYYFHAERGRAGLATYRRELTAQLWREWAPGRPFSAEAFDRTAASFDNPDFVEIVIHSYRHRYGFASGDPAYQADEDALARRPVIAVPTIILDPTEDPMVEPQPVEVHRERFSHLVDVRRVASGHDMPSHEPDSVTAAVFDLHAARGSVAGSSGE